MTRGAARGGPNGASDPVKPVLDVMLLYEDIGTALRAKHSLDLMASQLGADAGLRAGLWRLDLLGEPLRAEQAAIEAAAADVIILSLHGRKELQGEVREWLGRWLEHREDRPYALGALLDPVPAHSAQDHPVATYLKRVAKTAGFDFFYGVSDSTTLAPSASAGESLNRPRPSALPSSEVPNRAKPRG